MAQSSASPSGIVTFVMTDIVGSTRLWESDGEAAGRAVARHYEVIDEAVARNGGVRPVEQGEGDSSLSVFGRASDAVRAALDVQRLLQGEPWPEGAGIRVRIGVHSGEAQPREDGNYSGPALNRCARMRSIAHGGQTLLSRATVDLVAEHLPDGAALVDLGEHRLRDLTRPEHVFQLSHPDLPGEFPPLRSLDVLPNNLPVQLSTFIGREAEIAELRRLVQDNRLVTLIGTGGCGKTRLGLHLAAELADGYPDGVHWADLSPLADPALVAKAVAAALNVREVPGQPVAETLANRLRERAMLMLLDNCEHVAGEAAALADGLLRSCPRLTLLTTSREPLGVPGETAWHVPSLSVPPERAAGDPERLAESEAVRLFLDRAARSRPHFRLSADNADAIATICRRLDGIPLALELAAARTRSLAPAQIAEGLADRFRLLTGGARTALPRQRTLEASVEWSHTLLGEDERVLFRRMAVFAGGFTVEAAERVCGRDGIEELAVLDLLSQLVDRSLVQLEECDGEARYRMLETIRDYARHRLTDSGEAPVVRDRHLEYFLELVERAEPELEGQAMTRWIGPLHREIDNLRGALDWGVESSRADEALRISAALLIFWFSRDLLHEGVQRLRAALALEGGSPASRAKALSAASGLGAWLMLPDCADLGQEALALAREAGDRRTAGRSLSWLGFIASFGEPATARPLLAEALATAEECGDAWGVCLTSATLAHAENQAGNHQAARAHIERARTIARSSLDAFQTERALWWSGAVLAFSDPRAAAGYVDEVISIARALDDWSFLELGLAMRAWPAIESGEYGLARELLEEALTLANQTGWGPHLAFASELRAMLEYAEGDAAAAREWAERALQLGREVVTQFLISYGLCLLALADLAAGDPGTARRHAEESLAVARDAKELLWCEAYALLALARIFRADRDVGGAEDLVHDVLRISLGGDYRLHIALALEELAGLAAIGGSAEEAARLFGAAGALRETLGYARYPVDQPRYEADVTLAREVLGDDAYDAAWKEGAALGMEEAIAYATRARGERKRPSAGWASLTPTEIQVVRLAREGLTNPQIGERMFISRGTVRTHLSHIFQKVGVSTRAELAAEATRRDI